MLKLLLLSIIIAAVIAVVCPQGAAKEPLPLEKATFKDATCGVLLYQLMKPVKVEEGVKYPLVIFLHGAGERGDNNESQLVHGVPQFASKENREKYPCFLIAPQCPVKNKWCEVDWSAETHTMPKEASEPAKKLFELIEKMVKESPIDPKRIYITGLSMGGYGTWDLIARRPELFAAAVPVCGGGDEATVEKFKDIPVWAFHGGKDTVVKPKRSQAMIKALEAVGAKPKYTEYPTVGHDSWNPAYKDAQLFKWLFEQKKK